MDEVPMPVNTPRPDYTVFLPQWERCRDLAEGSDAVKAKGSAYLPMLGSHVKDGERGRARYEAYKLRALYYNATGRTIQGLAGAVFQKPPVFEVPSGIKDHLVDLTLGGMSAEMYARALTHDVLTVGRGGTLIEWAEAPSDPTAPQTKAGRPYFVNYRAEDIIAWRTERLAGDEVLTRVVLREYVEEPDPKDEFADETVEQYRVLSIGMPKDARSAAYMFEVWRKVGDQWRRVKDGTPMRRGMALPFIPFVFVGPTSTSPTIEKPPLRDLVDVNMSHYHTMADLEHGRHWTALPTPWVSGLTDTEKLLYIGSETAWHLGEKGEAGMLEFTGQGLKSLETADAEKRHMMATLGARLLEEQPKSAETAAAVGMRHAGEHATLRTIAGAVEQAMTQALRIHGWWVGTEAAPADVKATCALNKDFFGVVLTPTQAKELVLSWQAGGMSWPTLYHNLQRGDLTRPGITAEQERQEIEREGTVRRETEPPPDDAGGE